MWKHYIVEIDIHFYFLIWRYCSCHCPYFLYIFLKTAFCSLPILVTHFKSIIQLILGCSQDCAIIIIINLRAFSFPQEHPQPLVIIPHSPSSSQRESRRCAVSQGWGDVRKGPWAEQYGQHIVFEKDKEINSPREECSPADPWKSAHWDTCQTSDL